VVWDGYRALAERKGSDADLLQVTTWL